MKKKFKTIANKYIHKCLVKNYNLTRGIISWFEDKVRKEHVLAGIAVYILNNGHKVSDYPVSDIFVLGDTLYIHTHRPGLWIGKGGQTIDGIKDSINKGHKNVVVNDIQFIEHKRPADYELSMYYNMYHNIGNW